MTLSALVTILAIILGPVIAVVLTFEIERFRRARDRKMDVFRSLMKTRRRRLDPEHISALNLVEIEFHKNKRVLERFHNLLAFFESGVQRRDDETDEQFNVRYANEHSDRLTALLDEMGRSLGYGYQQLEILRGGYHPKFYGEVEQKQEKALTLFSDLYDGKRVMPIAVVDYRTADQIRSAAAAIEETVSKRSAEKK